MLDISKVILGEANIKAQDRSGENLARGILGFGDAISEGLSKLLDQKAKLIEEDRDRRDVETLTSIAAVSSNQEDFTKKVALAKFNHPQKILPFVLGIRQRMAEQENTNRQVGIMVSRNAAIAKREEEAAKEQRRHNLQTESLSDKELEAIINRNAAIAKREEEALREKERHDVEMENISKLSAVSSMFKANKPTAPKVSSDYLRASDQVDAEIRAGKTTPENRDARISEIMETQLNAEVLSRLGRSYEAQKGIVEAKGRERRLTAGMVAELQKDRELEVLKQRHRNMVDLFYKKIYSLPPDKALSAYINSQDIMKDVSPEFANKLKDYVNKALQGTKSQQLMAMEEIRSSLVGSDPSSITTSLSSVTSLANQALQEFKSSGGEISQGKLVGGNSEVRDRLIKLLRERKRLQRELSLAGKQGD